MSEHRNRTAEWWRSYVHQIQKSWAIAGNVSTMHTSANLWVFGENISPWEIMLFWDTRHHIPWYLSGPRPTWRRCLGLSGVSWDLLSEAQRARRWSYVPSSISCTLWTAVRIHPWMNTPSQILAGVSGEGLTANRRPVGPYSRCTTWGSKCHIFCAAVRETCSCMTATVNGLFDPVAFWS